MKTFHGRVAVISGAAHGIGRALAELLAAEGAKLVLLDVDESALARTQDALGPIATAELRTRALDVRDAQAWVDLAEEVQADLGGCQLLVNNAGVTAAGNFLEMTPQDFNWVLDVNLHGVIRGTRAFLPQLLQASEGWIVNLSSLFGLVGVPNQVAYCTSKYAVRGFSEALAQELRGTRVGMTMVHPGGVATQIIRHARVEDGADREHVQAFFDRYGMPPSRAADSILNAVRRRRRRVLVGKEAWLGDWMVRLSPILGMDRAVDGLVRGSGLEHLVRKLEA